jgi:cell pole-organizing protein PopZ
MRQVGEPSVEEILESIKKVIARDNRGDLADERASGAADNAPSAERGDAERDVEAILDLAESGSMVSIDELDLDDESDDEPEAPLLDEGTRTSMRDSLAALAMLSQPGVPPQIVRSGETSLEGLVRELLRPALAEWLDKNLPAMVERLVATEIARIVGKKG